MKIHYLILIHVFFFFSLCIEAKENNTIFLYDLQCEYLTNPLGIDVEKPRLSWRIGENDINIRGQEQTAYHVLVASSKILLEKGKSDIWDSKKVKSNQSLNIEYKGRILKSNTRYYWKVRIVDKDGKWSDWSEIAEWTMGLFPSDWKAKWIGEADALGKKLNDPQTDNTMHDPWFRKRFSLSEQPQQALIYVASIGFHELYVNGKKVGEKVLVPSVTDHKKRARYVTYDIKEHLVPGENVIALWLGVSWSIFRPYQTDDKPAAPIVLVQSNIQLPANKNIRIISDETWKTHPSPNRLTGYWEAHHFGGEIYDATQDIEDWNTPHFDDSQWKNATIFSPNLILSADKTDANKLIAEIKPISIKEVKPNEYRIDMGRNFAGWFQMEISGEVGDEIQFGFSENENNKSDFGIESKYIIGSKGKGTFSNKFNYMTGRWVYISGLKYKPRPEHIKAWLIRPDYKRAGNFECDVPIFNKIYDTSLWTFENLSLGNYMVDCPHRERCGYGGDALATTRLGMGNYQMGAFYTKWMEDWRDVQGEDGDVPHTAPTYIGGGGPSWSGYCITLPWEMYCQYGDTRILEESFPLIEKWLAFLETKSANDMLVRWGGKWSFLGDWLWPKAWDERKEMEKQGKALGDTEETLFFNNCHWIYSLETAAKIADIIKLTDKAGEYRERANEIRKAVHAQFFNSENNSYVNGYQSYLAMALNVDLPPKYLKKDVWKSFEDEIRIKRDGHFWGGITAGSYLFYTLMDNNRNDLLNAMISKEDYPSWGEMINCGLGTFYENWGCGGSGLHSSYLYVGSWFIESLGGIKHQNDGYKSIKIEPWINSKEGPKWVNSHFESPYGRIISNWEIENNTLSISIQIPPNTNAILCLNGIDKNSIRENNVNLLKNKPTDSSKLEIPLKAGNYRFTARLSD